MLLQRGAEIDVQDGKGYTALVVAATTGHERVVELLLQHGADVSLQKKNCSVFKGKNASLRPPLTLTLLPYSRL